MYIYIYECLYVYVYDYIIYGMFIPSVLIPYFHPIQFEDTGHQIIEMLNADRTLRIEMAAWRQPVIFAAEN